MKFPALPVLVQLGVGEQLIGVDLDLVGAEPRPKPGEVFPVAVRGRAEQVGHPVQNDFEAARAQEGGRVERFLNGVAAFVQVENGIVKTLRAHLYFRRAQMPKPGQLAGVHMIRAGFDDEADVAVLGGFVELLGGEEVVSEAEQGAVIGRFGEFVGTRRNGWRLGELLGTVVHGLETAEGEPFLVVAAVGTPGAAQDEQFDFVGGVADGFEGGEAVADLGVGVELVLEGTPRAGFVGEVAFRHPPVGGAENALAGAGVGLGQHGNGGDAGEGSHRFHAEAFQKFRFGFEFAQFDGLVVRGDQELFAHVAAAFARERVAFDGFKDGDARAHVEQGGAGGFHPGGGSFAGLPPGFALGVEFLI